MFCAKCGATNDNNAFRCVSCGEVLMRGGPVDASGLGPASAPLAQAILVTLFCCLPAGIVSIIYASQVSGKNNQGEFAQAHALAKKATTWAWVSFGIGGAVIAVYIVLALLGALGGAGRP